MILLLLLVVHEVEVLVACMLLLEVEVVRVGVAQEEFQCMFVLGDSKPRRYFSWNILGLEDSS